MEPKNITLPNGQVISTSDPNYAEYADGIEFEKQMKLATPPKVEPAIIKDQNEDLVTGSGNISKQADQLQADYAKTMAATAQPEVDPLAALRAEQAGINTTTTEEEKRIKQAGIDAGAQFDTLIGQAKREKGKGLGGAEISAGEAGGFMNTQMVGASAEPGMGAEKSRVAGRYGVGGELARVKSEYDANIANLETQKLAAISQAEESMRTFIRTGKQSAFDNAYKMFEAAQAVSKAKTEEANALADRIMKLNNYQLELDKFDYQQFSDAQKNALENAKLDIDIAGLTGNWNGAQTLAAKKQIADQAYQKFGMELDEKKFKEMVRNNTFSNSLEQLKLGLETSKFEAEKNGEDVSSTVEMVMNGTMDYDDALKNLKYGKQAFLQQLSAYKNLNNEAYNETKNDYYKIKNSVGGKPMTATAAESIAKMSMANDSLASINAKWNELKNNGKLGIIMGNIAKKNFTDADAIAISRQLQALVPTVARGVFGEVGVLTDNDVKLYRSAILDIGDPIKAQEVVFNNLLDTIESKFSSTLRSNADAKVDVSGYADSYKEFYNNVNAYRTNPKQIKYSSNPATYDSIADYRSTIGEEKYSKWMDKAIGDMTAAGITDPDEYFQAIKEAAVNKELYKNLPEPETTITPSFNKVGADTDKGVKQIGQLSQKYESGGDPGAIGYDKTGGYSYGTYQLAHSNAKKFIDQSKYAKEFKGLTFNSPEWQNKWKEVAKKDPTGFKDAQHNYIAQTHYIPQLNLLVNKGIDINKFSPVLADVVWSTAVQHGGNTDVIINAYNDAKRKLGREPNDKEFITQIYNERATRFPSSTPKVQVAVKNRFKNELNQALSMLA